MSTSTHGNGQGRSSEPGADTSFLNRFKEFRLTSFAVAHSTSMLVLFAIITLGGFLAYGAIPKESFPEIEVPFIAVNTVYPGVAPADMESLVTRKIEEELNTISDIKELTSSSVEGYSSVVAEFETTVDLNEALQQVREKVDLAKPELPADAEDPAIVEFNFDEVPVVQVNLSGEYGLVRLKEIGENLQDRLEQLPSVLRVDLRGGLEREVKVDVDLAKLKFYDIAMNDVVEAVAFENVNIPGGAIDVGALKYLVRIDGEFEDPSVIKDLVITTMNGRPIYVRDVATVEFGFAERESYARLDGAPVVTLDVIKRSGQNIIETASEVRQVVADMEPLFPPTTVVKITSDTSKDIQSMVSNLENNIVSGLILIVAVLFFFLGVRTSIFVALSIPTSMLLSFLILGVLGVSMNMVVLFSLILALGMLVDNAIVVVENIYRYVENGWDRGVAARKATGEVAMPVIAATLTTLAAFTPLLFWPGIVGEFMGYLPLTLIVTLSSSLFVALVIIPTFCALWLHTDREEWHPLTREAKWVLWISVALVLLLVASRNPLTAGLFVATAGIVFLTHRFVLSRVEKWFQRRGLPNIVRYYEVGLRWALGHRLVIIFGSAAVLVGSFFIFGAFSQGIEYFPEDIPPKQVIVGIETPVGTRAAFTDEIALRIEEELLAVEGLVEAESKVTTTGSSGGGGNLMGGGPGGPNASRLLLQFIDYEDRSYDVFQTLAEMQGTVGKDIAGAEINVDKIEEGPGGGPPINIEIVGEDPDVLKSLSDEVLAILRGAPIFERLVGLESDLDAARPELSVIVDRQQAALWGLTTNDVGRAVRSAINGVEAAKFRTGNDEYDIIVRLAPEYREDLSQLADLTVMSEGQQIPILSVARWEVNEGYGTIRRKDMDRMATISSEVAAGYNTNAVMAEARRTLADFQANLPPGYTLRMTGQSQDQDEATAFLSRAFLIALALIGFILVSQFNSVVKPVIILTSVIMSTSGVLLGLVLFRMPFGIIMTGVGVISLAGIVVNNAIVLIDYIDILRTRDGMDRREALVQGGKTRFRPVVLTAVTTALGLVPLAIGLNFDFFGLYRELNPELFWGGEQAAWWGPMAIAVIAGIIFATFLTLVLVPVMYSLVDDMTDFMRRRFLKSTPEEASPQPSEAEVTTAPEREIPEPWITEPEPAGVRRERVVPPSFVTPPLRPQTD
jgi:multidrug efflux pump subunit AcrB